MESKVIGTPDIKLPNVKPHSVEDQEIESV
jgi:hypothetical protein